MTPALSPPPVHWLAAHMPAGSLPLDPEVLRIYETAYFIGAETERKPAEDGQPGGWYPPISFTTVMAALLRGQDPSSQWFASCARELGPKEAKVFAKKNITAAVPGSATGHRDPPIHLVMSDDKQVLTTSSRSVLKNAEAWAQRVGGTEVGVRHLLASYLINPPPNHRRDLVEWEVDEQAWREPFFGWVAPLHTYEQWVEASTGPAPTRAMAAFEAPVSAKSLNWHGDRLATQILERAARTHELRGDTWLRLGTLLHAFFASVQEDAGATAALVPFRDALDRSNGRYTSWAIEYPTKGSTPQPDGRAFDDLDITPRVLNVLETARELATTLARGGQRAARAAEVRGHHLGAALISRRVDADDHFTEIGVNAQELRASLVALAEDNHDSADVWREVLGDEELIFATRPTSLNCDEAEAVVRADAEWKDDPLAIRGDVGSFASLIASRSLEPPLSIGLFGPWGSGKTTFLKRLRRTIDQRCHEVREGTGAFVQNVVHVEFNAWHYSEQALASSLVEAIFRETSAFISSAQPQLGQAWLEEKRRQFTSVKLKADAAESVRAAALSAAKAAEVDLAATRAEAAREAARLSALTQRAWRAARTSMASNDVVKQSGVLNTLGEAAESGRELRAQMAELRGRPANLLGALGWGRLLLFAAAVLGLPPLTTWLAERLFGLEGMNLVLSSGAALLSTLAVWAKTASGAAQRLNRALGMVSAEFERQLAEDPHLRAAQASLQAADARVSAAEVGATAARGELARAQADLATAALPAQVLQLVDRRIHDEIYKKELTSLSTIRADLQALSQIMREQRQAQTDGSGDIRPVERVVLYVDDLDRCRPDQVVRVLQLVHMLLTFELFVVVVAVDARWVSVSLKDSYEWLNNEDSAVTPQEYLEKIFQISFWLEPMTATRAADYLKSLVRVSAVSGQQKASAEITAVELDYLKALSAHLGPSPRRVKRLVNSYRLLKARLSDTQLAQFVTGESPTGPNSGPYQLVIALLAISNGAAGAASDILTAIAQCDPLEPLEAMISRLRGKGHPSWNMAARVIEALGRTQSSPSVTELRGWARKVARFLLQGPSDSRGGPEPDHHARPAPPTGAVMAQA
jgi:hypothetical protein